MDESARQSPEAYGATRPCVPEVDTLEVSSDILHAAAPLIRALELRLETDSLAFERRDQDERYTRGS